MRRYLTVVSLSSILLTLFLGLCVSALGLGLSYPLLWPREWDFSILSEIGSRGQLFSSFASSLWIACAVAIASTISAFAVRLISFYSQPEQGLQLFIFYLPYLIAPVVLAVALQILFLRLGWAGTYTAIIMGQFCITLPYAIILQDRIWGQSLLSTVQMGLNFGLSSFQILRCIIWPAARGLLILSTIQTFLISWFDFALVQFLGMGRVRTLTLSLYTAVLESDVQQASFAAIAIILPGFLLMLLFYRIFIQKAMSI